THSSLSPFICRFRNSAYGGGAIPDNDISVVSPSLRMPVWRTSLTLRLQPIDIDTLPGNIAGLICRQEDNGISLVLRFTQTSQGHANTENLHIPLQLPLTPRFRRTWSLRHTRILAQVGNSSPWTYSIHRNLVLCQLHRQTASKVQDGCFRDTIRPDLPAWHLRCRPGCIHHAPPTPCDH